MHVTLQRGSEVPRMDYPPINTYWFSGRAFTAGVKIHELDGVGVRIYSPEKALADCFKFRNKIGLDTAMEAIRLYRDRRRVDVKALIRYAAICRVEKIIRSYRQDCSAGITANDLNLPNLYAFLLLPYLSLGLRVK